MAQGFSLDVNLKRLSHEGRTTRKEIMVKRVSWILALMLVVVFAGLFAWETVFVGRMGKKGKEFKVSSAYMKKVEEKGRLYLLRIKTAESVEEPEGTFKVKVRVQK